ncbi:MAG: hypothetical protein LBL07_00615 [Tannerella sp.]|jgi:hypothetical protein|nr:hypothetical protein [Tannerella sp.]
MIQQRQIQLQAKMKMLDDVFHHTIVSLERLELFLEAEKGATENLKYTALKTNRDRHDDYQRPPTKDSFYGEIQLQCSALLFQTAFDDKETFEKVVKYFLQDLLEWYGGRNESIQPNDVEKFFVPVAVVISRQIESVLEVTKAVTEYVCDIRRIDSMTDAEKEAAVKAGIDAFIKAGPIVHVDMQTFLDKNEEVKLTVHQRGTMEEGVVRLYKSFETLYNDKAPSLLLYKLLNQYFPEKNAKLTDYTEESITIFFESKKEESKPEEGDKKE